jgi:hypothetical protein
MTNIAHQMGQQDSHDKGKSRQQIARTRKSSLPYVNPQDRYHISASMRDSIGLDDWLVDIQAKYGVQVCILIEMLVSVC